MSSYTDNKLSIDKNTAWQQVLDLIEPGWELLDIGCSSGTLGSELIQSKQCIVDGIEIDKKDAGIAKSKLRQVELANVEQDDLSKLFKGKKYDAIMFIDVIEHLVDPSTALKKIKPMLKPGGVVVFSIPNMAHLSIRLALLNGDFDYTQAGLLDKTHLHFYTGKEIEHVFNNASYKIETFNCSSFTYPEQLTQSLLNKIGLKASDVFFKKIEETYGNVYQYVGTARPTSSSTGCKVVVPCRNPHEKDYKEIEKIIEGYKSNKKQLEEAIHSRDEHIKYLEKSLEELQKKRVVKISKKLHLMD